MLENKLHSNIKNKIRKYTRIIQVHTSFSY